MYKYQVNRALTTIFGLHKRGTCKFNGDGKTFLTMSSFSNVLSKTNVDITIFTEQRELK